MECHRRYEYRIKDEDEQAEQEEKDEAMQQNDRIEEIDKIDIQQDDKFHASISEEYEG